MFYSDPDSLSLMPCSLSQGDTSLSEWQRLLLSQLKQYFIGNELERSCMSVM